MLGRLMKLFAREAVNSYQPAPRQRKPRNPNGEPYFNSYYESGMGKEYSNPPVCEHGVQAYSWNHYPLSRGVTPALIKSVNLARGTPKGREFADMMAWQTVKSNDGFWYGAGEINGYLAVDLKALDVKFKAEGTFTITYRGCFQQAWGFHASVRSSEGPKATVSSWDLHPTEYGKTRTVYDPTDLHKQVLDTLTDRLEAQCDKLNRLTQPYTPHTGRVVPISRLRQCQSVAKGSLEKRGLELTREHIAADLQGVYNLTAEQAEMAVTLCRQLTSPARAADRDAIITQVRTESQ